MVGGAVWRRDTVTGGHGANAAVNDRTIYDPAIYDTAVDGRTVDDEPVIIDLPGAVRP